MKRLFRLLRSMFRRHCRHDSLSWPRYVVWYADAERTDDGFVQTCWTCAEVVPAKVEFAHRVVVKRH